MLGASDALLVDLTVIRIIMSFSFEAGPTFINA